MLFVTMLTFHNGDLRRTPIPQPGSTRKDEHQRQKGAVLPRMKATALLPTTQIHKKVVLVDVINEGSFTETVEP